MEDNLNYVLKETSKIFEESERRIKEFTPDKAFGLRDALLVKCRDAINDLHLDIEREKRTRISAEATMREALGKAEELAQENIKLQGTIETNIEIISNLESECTNSKRTKELEILRKNQDFSSQTENEQKIQTLEKTVGTLTKELRQTEEYAAELENQIEFLKNNANHEIREIERNLRTEYQYKQKDFSRDQERAFALEEVLQKKTDDLKNYLSENEELREDNNYLQEMLDRKQLQLEKYNRESAKRLLGNNQYTQESLILREKVSLLEDALKEERQVSAKIQESLNSMLTADRDTQDSEYKQLYSQEVKLRIKEKQEYLTQMKENKQAFYNKMNQLEGKVGEIDAERNRLVKQVELSKRSDSLMRDNAVSSLADTTPRRNKKSKRKRKGKGDEYLETRIRPYRH